MISRDYKKDWMGEEFDNVFSEETVVCEGCEVMHSKMDHYSRLKSYCHLRGSVLGDYSIVSNGTYINASDIGKFCSIGYGNFVGLWEHNLCVTTHSFYLYETSGGFVDGYQPYEKDKMRTTIGNDVWTGANSVIIKGVTVGDGAVVGAGSVVTKDVPAYAIVVGNPARLLRYRFDEDTKAYLLRVKWWNFDRQLIQELTNKKAWGSIDKFKDYLENTASRS